MTAANEPRREASKTTPDDGSKMDRLEVVDRARKAPSARRRGRLLLTVEETAIMLGIGRTTMLRAVRNGAVPFPVHKIGGSTYVPRAAVERLLAGEAPIVAAGSRSAPDDQVDTRGA